MQEVDVLPIDGGGELRIGIKFLFPHPPVISLLPVLDQPLDGVQGYPVVPPASGSSLVQRTRTSRAFRSSKSACGTAMVKGAIDIFLFILRRMTTFLCDTVLQSE